jgi:hypothetical protein
MNTLWSVIADELEEEMPMIAPAHIPSAEGAREISNSLYNSQNDYITQMSAYKKFQGKTRFQDAA